MRVQFILLCLLLAGLATTSSGCLAVVAGAGAAGTVAYLRGDVEAEEPYDLNTVYAAARKAIKQLELSVLEGKTEKDALSATIMARDADDKRVTIKLWAQTERSTHVSVRIGTFGDETKEQMIYHRIRENLKAAAVPASESAAPSPPPPPAAKPPAPPTLSPAAASPPASAPPSVAAPPLASPPAPQ